MVIIQSLLKIWIFTMEWNLIRDLRMLEEVQTSFQLKTPWIYFLWLMVVLLGNPPHMIMICKLSIKIETQDFMQPLYTMGPLGLTQRIKISYNGNIDGMEMVRIPVLIFQEKLLGRIENQREFI